MNIITQKIIENSPLSDGNQNKSALIFNNGVVSSVGKNIATISATISGGCVQTCYSTIYTEKQNITDKLLFDLSETPRLLDIEKEIKDFENKYKIKSEIFYKAWKSDASFDNDDFNQWAKLCKYIDYAK